MSLTFTIVQQAAASSVFDDALSCFLRTVLEIDISWKKLHHWVAAAKKNELISSTSQFLVSARHSIFLGEKTTNSFSAFSAFSHHQPWPIPQKEFVFPKNTILCCSGLKKTLNRKFWYQFLKLEHSAAWLSDV